MELSSQIVEAILAGNTPYVDHRSGSKPWLLLSAFTACANHDLEQLLSNIGPLEGIELGLRELSEIGASLLCRVELEYFFLPGLVSLSDETAHILGYWPFESRPVREMRFDQPISATTAYKLVELTPSDCQCDRPLSISLPSITPDVAQALSQQSHELYLDIRNHALGSDIASELANHKGYSLWVTSDCKFSDQSLRVLSASHIKQVRVESGGNRVCLYDATANHLK